MPPVRAESQMFMDTFDSSANWNLGRGWTIIDDDGNSILKGENHSFTTAIIPGTVESLKLRIKILQGSVRLNVRTQKGESGLARYFIELSENGSSICKEQGGNLEFMGGGEKGITLNQWHEIEINFTGNNINAWADGELLVYTQDKVLLNAGSISFETSDDAVVYFDDVEAEMSVPEQEVLDATELFQNGEHKGDITMSGGEVLVLETGEFEQFGDIYLKNGSKLIVRNATLQITRYQIAEWHSGIYLEDYSSLEINNSILRPGEDTGFVVEARGMSHVSMENSPTKVHLFIIEDNARAVVESSEILSDIGGAVGAFDRGVVKVKNSKIGAILINVPLDATLLADGLDTGFFKEWSLQNNLSISGINSNIILEDTELVSDDLEQGGFERSWTLLIHSSVDISANVSIRNSNVRRIVIVLDDENAEFCNLHLGRPSNFKYRNIELENVTVSGQWGIHLMHGSSDVVVRDSDGLFIILSNNSNLTLINTRINEFNINNFHGEIIFENSTMIYPPMIIGNNDFVIKGDVIINPNLTAGTTWKNSSVTKFYYVLGEKETELTLEKDGNIVWSGKTDQNGEAEFSIKLNDNTFDDKWVLKDNLENSIEIGFFSETPIKLVKVGQQSEILLWMAVILILIGIFVATRIMKTTIPQGTRSF